MATEISLYRDLRAVYVIHSILKASCDVLHLHSSKAGVLGRLAGFLIRYDSAIFFTPHGFSFIRKDISRLKYFLYKTIETFSARLCGITLACSSSESDHATRLFWGNRVCLIENAINLGGFTSINYKDKGKVRITTVGRLSPPKNPNTFRYLAIEMETEPVEFLWVGDGELVDSLKCNGVFPTNISVTGWLDTDAVFRELYASDIFLMTSLWEGMPISLIESQAVGLPAVVPDVDGCRDVVIDGVTGFICNTLDEMKSRLRQLILNADLRCELGREARRRALTRFSPERMHKEIMQAYHAEVEKKPKSSCRKKD